MKIITYNINGYRAAQKKEIEKWIQIVNPDIIGLQEIKALERQVDLTKIKNQGYFTYWNSAQKKGYSGVAIFSKQKPINIQYGINQQIDEEGRVITLEFNNFIIVNIYFPSGASSPERQQIKLLFLQQIEKWVVNLKKINKYIIIMGDFNIAHLSIDIHNPIKYSNVPGFTNEERDWISSFLLQNNFFDTVRFFHQQAKLYSWWSYMNRSRERNIGWRIDYMICSNSLKLKLKTAYHLPLAYHSDHCPVVAEFDKF